MTLIPEDEHYGWEGNYCLTSIVNVYTEEKEIESTVDNKSLLCKRASLVYTAEVNFKGGDNMEKAVPDEINKKIGEFIRKRREEIGISRTDLAKALRYKLPNMIAMVETGATTFPLKRTPDYADALQLPLHELAREVFTETFPFLKGLVTFHSKKQVCVLREIKQPPAAQVKKTTGPDII